MKSYEITLRKLLYHCLGVDKNLELKHVEEG